MSATARRDGVVGRFAHLDEMLDALRRARAAGLVVRDVFTPVPVPEAVELVSPGRSPVRFATLAGGLAGCFGGIALAVGTSLVWDLVVGGKPVTALVPFMVVAFELTILLGALFTLLALLLFAHLPNRGFPGPAFLRSFSADRFGVWITCAPTQQDRAAQLLESAGAEVVFEVSDGLYEWAREEVRS